MAVTYSYPTDAALKLIDQDYLDQMGQTDPIFDLFPMRNTSDDLLVWEQRDNSNGLTQVRGMNGDPPSVKKLGAKRYMMTPGVYGEFIPIDEMEMTRRRPLGQFNGQISIGDLVTEAQNQLRTRQMNRVRWVLWQLLVNGTFNVFAADGSLAHSDSFKQTNFVSQVPWTTYATSTPLADLRSVQLLSRGHSVSFGAGALAFMNQYTTNVMLSSTNPADIYGRRTQGLGSYNSLDQVNQLYAGDGLPKVVVYDDGYLSDGTDGFAVGSYQLYLPDGYVVIIGKRPNNASVGEFRFTRNVNGDNQGGVYVKTFDNQDREVPRKIEEHRGFNGGPVVYYGSAIVVAKVF